MITRIYISVIDFSLDTHLARKKRLMGYQKVLSEDELARAKNFAIKTARDAFICSRGFVRHALAHKLLVKPHEIRFGYGRHQKPYVKYPLSARPLHFNVSHSSTVTILAWSEDAAIGIDVEKMRPILQVRKIAARFFSKQEMERLQALEKTHFQKQFFRTWTTREAAVKAMGGSIFRDQLDLRAFSFFRLKMPKGYVATLAAPSGSIQVTRKKAS